MRTENAGSGLGGQPVDFLLRIFPSWNPGDVVEILRTCCMLAQSGCGDTTLHLLGHGKMVFNCPGDGTLALDPIKSTCTARTLELARGLRLLLNGKFTIPGVIE
jgi:hypothetical protein